MRDHLGRARGGRGALSEDAREACEATTDRQRVPPAGFKRLPLPRSRGNVQVEGHDDEEGRVAPAEGQLIGGVRLDERDAPEANRGDYLNDGHVEDLLGEEGKALGEYYELFVVVVVVVVVCARVGILRGGGVLLLRLSNVDR